MGAPGTIDDPRSDQFAKTSLAAASERFGPPQSLPMIRGRVLVVSEAHRRVDGGLRASAPTVELQGTRDCDVEAIDALAAGGPRGGVANEVVQRVPVEGRLLQAVRPCEGR